METNLAGQGSEARVTGAYAGDGGQHLDFDTTQEHAAPNTTSDLAFRGVLEDGATAVWRGMIRVDPGAQQTDAFQESRNLLLSKRPTPTRSPASRSRPTTSAAPTPRRSPRSTPTSSTTCARAASPGRGEAADHRGLPRGTGRAPAEGPVREEVSAALERRLAEIL